MVNWKEVNWFNIILIVVLVVFIVWLIIDNHSENRGWRSDYLFSDWLYYTYDDYNFSVSNDCNLVACVDVQTEENTIMKECLCEGTERKVKVLATSRIKRQVYEWEDFSNEI